MRLTKLGTAALAVALAGSGCTGARLGSSQAAAALTAFDSCQALLDYAKEHALLASPQRFMDQAAGAAMAERSVVAADSSAGTTGGTAPPAPTTTLAASGDESFSVTNVQEKGVDEPDLVKTDGRRMITVQNGKLVVVDVTGAEPKKLGEYAFGPETPAGGDLLLDGDRVVVFGHGSYERLVEDVGGDVAGASAYYPSVQTLHVTVLDIGDPARIKQVAALSFEGDYVSARSANGLVRLVVQSQPKMPAFPAGSGESYELAAKRAIDESTVTDWIPTYTLTKPGQAPVTAPLAACAEVLRPNDYSGMGAVSVVTIDPDDPKPQDTACVLGAGSIVYASAQSLYVATNSWTSVGMSGRRPMAPPAEAPGVVADAPVNRTRLHRFAIPTGKPAKYTASGEVDGNALNQFAISEHEGRLRLATTVWGAHDTDNVLHVLEEQDGKLVAVGRLAGLGHERETIHSVRFMGDRAYVVTFRQTDPLYVLDLSDPRNPRQLGELSMPGFSSYLHPLSDTALLGVGWGESEPGNRGDWGLQVSLFDVADPAKPVRKDNVVFTHMQSPAQRDHHAFNWWPKTGQLFIPVSGPLRTGYKNGVLALGVDPAKGFGEKKDVPKNNADIFIQRTVVVGDRLYTVAAEGLVVNDLATLGYQHFMVW